VVGTADSTGVAGKMSQNAAAQSAGAKVLFCTVAYLGEVNMPRPLGAGIVAHLVAETSKFTYRFTTRKPS